MRVHSQNSRMESLLLPTLVCEDSRASRISCLLPRHNPETHPIWGWQRSWTQDHHMVVNLPGRLRSSRTCEYVLAGYKLMCNTAASRNGAVLWVEKGVLSCSSIQYLVYSGSNGRSSWPTVYHSGPGSGISSSMSSMDGAEALISARILSSNSCSWSWIAEPFANVGVVAENVGSSKGEEWAETPFIVGTTVSVVGELHSFHLLHFLESCLLWIRKFGSAHWWRMYLIQSVAIFSSSMTITLLFWSRMTFRTFVHLWVSRNTWRKDGLENQGYGSGFTHLGIFVASWRWSPSSWSLSQTSVSRRLLEAAGSKYCVASPQLRPVICLMKKSLNGWVVEEVKWTHLILGLSKCWFSNSWRTFEDELVLERCQYCKLGKW